MSSIIDSISDGPELSREVMNQLNELITHRSLKKGEILQRKGDLNNEVYFVKRGLLRSYVLGPKGKEHTIMFAQEGRLFSNIDTSVKKLPSQIYIDALEDTELEIFDKDSAFAMSHIPQAMLLDVINRILNQLSSVQNKMILLLSANVAERYEYFNKTYPHLVQKVPQKIIASYLGITPQVLSKLRKPNRTSAK